jgi:hypothetical protein
MLLRGPKSKVSKPGGAYLFSPFQRGNVPVPKTVLFVNLNLIFLVSRSNRTQPKGIPGTYPDPDPGKLYGSLRIRIRGTGQKKKSKHKKGHPKAKRSSKGTSRKNN